MAIIGVYLAPMYLVGHWHRAAVAWFAAAALAVLVLYFTWYRTLPAAGTPTPALLRRRGRD